MCRSAAHAGGIFKTVLAADAGRTVVGTKPSVSWPKRWRNLPITYGPNLKRDRCPLGCRLVLQAR
jgi:hypothetical protein